MSYLNRFKELRNSLGLSQKEFADILFVNQTAVSQWERGVTTPSPNILLRICDLYNVTTDYLLGRDIEPKHTEIKYSVVHRIKVYGSVPAGIPLEAIEDIIDWEEVPIDWIKDGSEFIALKVKGDSMYPKYLDGDIVIIRIQLDCESGQDAIVYVNGFDATLKRVVKTNGTIILQPLNPAHETKVYGPGDYDITILGIVVELRRKI